MAAFNLFAGDMADAARSDVQIQAGNAAVLQRFDG